MSTHGMLEARMHITSSTAWSVLASYGGGGYSGLGVTFAGTDVYLRDVLDLLESNLNAYFGGGTGTNWTVSYDFGENGTGKVSITKEGTAWGIQWFSTEFRDICGFTGNITGTAGQVQTGTDIADTIWLPGTPKAAQYKDANPGHYVTDKRTTISPTGAIKTLYGNKYVEIPAVKWDTVAEARARGITVRGSWERLWYQSQLGEATFHDSGSTLRYYPDANAATAYAVRIPDMHTSDLKPLVQNWSGRYTVEIPKMLVQP